MPPSSQTPIYTPDETFVLGLDLDGVCGDYNRALRRVLAKKREVAEDSLPLAVSWNFPEWGLTREEFLELHEEAVTRHKIFFDMPVIEGAHDALWELSNQGVWIRVITHRLLTSGAHRTVAQDTVSWLDQHRIPYRELCFVGHKTEVGADVYIDDSPTNIDSLRANGGNVIVFEQHANLDKPGPRAKNWPEAQALVEAMMLESKGRLASPLPGIDVKNTPRDKNEAP